MTYDQPTAPAARRGFGPLPCPRCGQDATIRLDLDDLTGSESLTCPECDESFGVADVKEWMAKWSSVLAWIAVAPALPGDAP